MKRPPLQGRTLGLLAAAVPLLALFVYVVLRSGPLAPVAVTVTQVEQRAITAGLFGIGTVAARYTHKIGPTFAGRVKRLDVNVGDRVRAGQVLGEMEPVDLDDRLRSQSSASRRAEAALREAEARREYARLQALRYERLLAEGATSEEIFTAKRQELQVADATLAAAREDLARARSDRGGLEAQRGSLRLTAPIEGIVAVREADPGTTIVAGQAVVEVIDPRSLWINVRFDQASAAGLAPGLRARIVLRSRSARPLRGTVLRVEPVADSVTEETLAKVVLDDQLESLPPLGELAEVTVDLPALPVAPVVPTAAVRREGSQRGVWRIVDGDLRFASVELGVSDLDGRVQVREGLEAGDQVVVYSERALTARSRFHVVDSIRGVAR